MAKCKLCGKSGLFLSVDKDGYCKSCAETNERERQRKEQIRIKKEAERAKIMQIPKREIVPASELVKRNKGYANPPFSNITPKGKYYDFVVFDTETTGLSPSTDRIIELAAIRFQGGFPVEVFHTFINPEKPIPAEASAINHIYDKDVADAPKIGSVISAFDDFVGNGIVVAHNLEFDLKFVFYSGSRIIENGCTFIDTLEQAKRIKKKSEVFNYQLWSLCDDYGILIADEHSSLADAYATGKLFLSLVFDKQETMPTDIYKSLKS